MRNVSANVVEKIKTDFLFRNVFPKIDPVMRQYGKYGRGGQA
jgi:hypothetical protein